MCNEHTYHDAYVETKVQLEEVSSFLQVIRLGGKYPYSLSHLLSTVKILLKEIY